MTNTDYQSDTIKDVTPDPLGARRIVVLVSGNGSNLQALIDAQSHDRLGGGEIVAVISNVADAYGLKRAHEAGIEAVALPHREYDSREAYDGALIKVIERHEPDLIVLAGFMRILTPRFVQRFLGRMLNIHPSLLPEYQGLNTLSPKSWMVGPSYYKLSSRSALTTRWKHCRKKCVPVSIYSTRLQCSGFWKADCSSAPKAPKWTVICYPSMECGFLTPTLLKS